MQARVRPQLSSRELLWNRKGGLSSRTWRLSGRMDNRESLLSPPLEENKRTMALSEEECLFVPTLLQTRGGERREGGRERRGEKWRGEEEIGGGEDDKKREKEGGWMAERYGIWEMRTRFFSFFSFFFLFFSFFSFSPSLRSTKPIYRFLDLRREYFRCHYRMILWCTSYCERSRGRRDGEEREWKNMSCGLWSIYPLMINYWIDRR